jgi:fructose-specific phosphotransferase system component IIB
VLSEVGKNDVPLDGYTISVMSTGAIVKRHISKKDVKTTDIVVVRADISVKKGKKAF